MYCKQTIRDLDYLPLRAVLAKRAKKEKRTKRSSWSVNVYFYVNVYCNSAARCENKPGYLQKAEGGG